MNPRPTAAAGSPESLATPTPANALSVAPIVPTSPMPFVPSELIRTTSRSPHPRPCTHGNHHDPRLIPESSVSADRSQSAISSSIMDARHHDVLRARCSSGVIRSRREESRFSAVVPSKTTRSLPQVHIRRDDTTSARRFRWNQADHCAGWRTPGTPPPDQRYGRLRRFRRLRRLREAGDGRREAEGGRRKELLTTHDSRLLIAVSR